MIKLNWCFDRVVGVADFVYMVLCKYTPIQRWFLAIGNVVYYITYIFSRYLVYLTFCLNMYTGKIFAESKKILYSWLHHSAILSSSKPIQHISITLIFICTISQQNTLESSINHIKQRKYLLLFWLYQAMNFYFLL